MATFDLDKPEQRLSTAWIQNSANISSICDFFTAGSKLVQLGISAIFAAFPMSVTDEALENNERNLTLSSLFVGNGDNQQKNVYIYALRHKKRNKDPEQKKVKVSL